MKLIRRIFTVVIIVLILFATATFAFIQLYGDEIKSTIISALNEELNTKVDVSSVKIDFWNEFPSAAVSFKDVVIYSSLDQGDTLISGEAVNASFDLIEFYKRNFELTGLSLSKGNCFIVIDRAGNPNYLIFKNTTTEQNEFHFILEKIKLSNISFSYQDHYNDIDLSFRIQQAKARGDFTDSIYDLNLNAELLNSRLVTNDWLIINDRTVRLNGTSQINDVLKKISFSKTTLGVEDLDLTLDGSIEYLNATTLDLSIDTKNQDLQSAISVLPPKIKSFLADYSIGGDAYISGFLKGGVSKNRYPSYGFNFELRDGDISKNDGTVAFNQAFIKGRIENGEKNTLESTVLKIERFESNLLNGDLKGALTIENFISPKYQLDADVNVELAELVNFFKTKRLRQSNGKINSSFSLKGKMSSLNAYSLSDFKASQLNGAMLFTDIAFEDQTTDYSIEALNGSIQLENNKIQLDSIELSVNEQKVKANGQLINLLPFATDQNEKLIADLNLSSQSIDLNRLSTDDEEQKAFSFPKHILLYLDCNVESLKADKFTFNNLSSNIYLNQKQLDLRDCRFETFDGVVQGDFFLKQTSNGYKFLNACKLSNVDIVELFEDFDDFGQNTIKKENISGKLSADLHTNILFSENLEPILPSIKVDADFEITNGRLKDVKALEAFSNHIDLNELKDIRFKTITNQIYIENEKLYIPKMTVNSSALELTLYGEHSFQNQIDYHFVLLLSEVLGKKVKRPENDEFGYVEDDGLGRTKIFVKMYGTVDQPEFTYDTKALKKHLKSEVSKEKKTIKKLLNEEFGLFKNDSTYKNLELNTPTAKSPFTIEWDEKESKMPAKPKTTVKKDSNKSSKKGRFGKFIDKIAKPNEDEFVEPIDEK